MHKLITAALLGAALTTPLMAQGYPGDGDRHDRGAPGSRPDDRRGPPPEQRDQHRGGYGYQGRPDQGRPDQVQYRGQAYRPGGSGRPDGPRPSGGNGGPGFDRGPVVVGRGRPGGGGRHWDRPGRGGPGYADRGWDQRWRADSRYDWRGYRDSHRDHFAGQRYYAPGGYGYRRFERGYRIAPIFYDQRYWIADPYAYRLPPADGPYRWVRYFDDVLLIDLRSGLIVDEEPGFFY